MKNKLLIALTIPLALATSTNLQAMTKARSITQAAANYARNNKLKTTGMIIGGAIALDLLQTGARRRWHNYKYSDQIKAAKDAVDKASTDRDAKWAIFDKNRSTQEFRTAWEEALSKSSNLRFKYRGLLFDSGKVSFICIPLLRTLFQQAEKFRAWRNKARKGKRS